MSGLRGLSVFFPVYNDERTVERVTRKALDLGARQQLAVEVIIVDDGGPDASGEIADRLAAEHPEVRVVHHEKNLGYGAAVRSGLAECRYEWILFTDGDDEYDLYDFYKLWPLRDFYDLIITFRYVRRYSSSRIFISRIYNSIFRWLFRTSWRDVSTGLRLVRKDVVDQLDLQSVSPFIGAEIAIKTMLRGYRIGEVGIQTFPRDFGRGSATSTRNIALTIVDMFRCHRTVFSETYQLPHLGDRSRDRPGEVARRSTEAQSE